MTRRAERARLAGLAAVVAAAVASTAWSGTAHGVEVRSPVHVSAASSVLPLAHPPLETTPVLEVIVSIVAPSDRGLRGTITARSADIPGIRLSGVQGGLPFFSDGCGGFGWIAGTSAPRMTYVCPTGLGLYSRLDCEGRSGTSLDSGQSQFEIPAGEFVTLRAQLPARAAPWRRDHYRVTLSLRTTAGAVDLQVPVAGPAPLGAALIVQRARDRRVITGRTVPVRRRAPWLLTVDGTVRAAGMTDERGRFQTKFARTPRAGTVGAQVLGRRRSELASSQACVRRST